jgi:hypothetical protein
MQVDIPGLLRPRGKWLSSQQRLRVAMVLGRREVLKPCPENMARATKSEYERLALRVMETLKTGSISSLADNPHTRFLVRVFYPAQLSRIFLEAFARPEPKRVYCLLGSALRLIAFERLFLEMLAAGALSERGEEQSLNIQKLKAPRAEDFADPPQGHGYWLERFQAWYDAALSSLLLYLSRYCVEIASADPLRSNAALLGYMFNKAELPDLVREWAAEFFRRSDPELIRIFARNLEEPRPFEGEWKDAEFRTWLLEITPIVQGYQSGISRCSGKQPKGDSRAWKADSIRPSIWNTFGKSNFTSSSLPECLQAGGGRPTIPLADRLRWRRWPKSLRVSERDEARLGFLGNSVRWDDSDWREIG